MELGNRAPHTPLLHGSGELGGFVFEEAVEVRAQLGAAAVVVGEVDQLVRILLEVVPLVLLVLERGVDVVELRPWARPTKSARSACPPPTP